jgi:hypothetical protein
MEDIEDPAILTAAHAVQPGRSPVVKLEWPLAPTPLARVTPKASKLIKLRAIPSVTTDAHLPCPVSVSQRALRVWRGFGPRPPSSPVRTPKALKTRLNAFSISPSEAG